jgi:hypothetical protein
MSVPALKYHLGEQIKHDGWCLYQAWWEKQMDKSFYPILLYMADQLEEGCNQQGKLI